MDTLIGIKQQLGLDVSFFFQLALFVVLFFAAKFTFLERLQFIIENREEKTVKLENDADDTFDKVNQLSQKYNSRIEEAKYEAQQLFNERRIKTLKENDRTIKDAENEIELYINNARKENQESVEIKQKEVLNNAEELSNLLIDKIQAR